ncbi:hypothetical protein [Aliihoeflea sp. PC F10.4]
MTDFTRFDNATIEQVGANFMMKVFYAFLALALLSVGISYAGKTIGRTIALAGHTTDTTIQGVVIDGEMLAVPSNMIRFASERRSGDARKLDVYLSWPNLEGYSEEQRGLFNHAGTDNRIIFATFEPRSMPRDMSQRLNPIYRLLIEEPAEPVEAELVAHRFIEASGYGDEMLIVDPTRFRAPFVARCLSGPEAATALAPCERDIDVGANLSMRYRFPRALLTDWRELDASMQAFAVQALQASD